MPIIGVCRAARMCDYEAAMQRAGRRAARARPVHDDPPAWLTASTACC